MRGCKFDWYHQKYMDELAIDLEYVPSGALFADYWGDSCIYVKSESIDDDKYLCGRAAGW